MEHWDLRTLDVQPHQPQILHSSRGESRTIAIHLPAGERLKDHEVHERAHLVVVEGEVEVDADGASVRGGPGFVAVFDPGERHEVRATSDARLLLLLAPMTPHVAAELWELRRGGDIHAESWPAFDPALAAAVTETMVVQVNGKVRDRVEVDAGVDEAEMQRLALASAKVQAALGDTRPARVIARPPRLINLVV